MSRSIPNQVDQCAQLDIVGYTTKGHLIYHRTANLAWTVPLGPDNEQRTLAFGPSEMEAIRDALDRLYIALNPPPPASVGSR